MDLKLALNFDGKTSFWTDLDEQIEHNYFLTY